MSIEILTLVQKENHVDGKKCNWSLGFIMILQWFSLSDLVKYVSRENFEEIRVNSNILPLYYTQNLGTIFSIKQKWISYHIDQWINPYLLTKWMKLEVKRVVLKFFIFYGTFNQIQVKILLAKISFVA